MSEQQDDSQKTEDPTEKKLRDSRNKGQLAKSQEVNHWFIILALGLVLMLFAPTMANDIAAMLARFFEKAHSIPVDAGGGLGDMLIDMVLRLGTIMLLPMFVVLVAAFAANFVQIGPLLTAEPMKPKLEKISPLKGAKRLFSTRALVDFAKGIAKLSLVALVIFLMVWPEHENLGAVVQMALPDLLDYLLGLGIKVVGGTLAVMTVIAGLDVMYQRYKHFQEMKMSKQEIKDEHKQSEGDPQVKQRLRQLRMEKARKRMMAAVPSADVVVTNPTHYAIALAYEQGQLGAPRVVAKGVDAVALRIREVAEENDVPLVENPPLARALYAGVELDDEIPPEHYKAVAEIIGYVMRLKGKMPTARP